MNVDVILPVHRGVRWVSEAIDSVLAQTHSKWQLIIVGDGAEDDTLDFAQAAYAARSNRISFLRLPQRRGPGAARMEAIRNGSGECIAFIDQDDRWHPRKLELQLARLKRAPRVDAVHTDVQHIDTRGQPVRRSANRENARRRRTRYDRLHPDALMRHLFLHSSSIRLVSALLTRDAFETVGGFDEAALGGEDWAFWIGLAAAGYGVGHLATPLVDRRLHADNASRQPFWRDGHRRRLDQVIQMYPDLRHLAPRRAATLLREDVLHRLAAGAGPQVLREICKIIHLAPTDGRGYALLLLSCIGPAARPLVRRVLA